MKILFFGGTGSLGKILLKTLQKKGETYVFSRSEEKHVNIKQLFPMVNSIIGDIRDYNSVKRAINIVDPDIVINAAALKNVPECECFPAEAMKTNAIGTFNLVNALDDFKKSSIKSLFVSTDKCVKSVNSYGMSKALAERIHLTSKNSIPSIVRYGNVLLSRGSVIPVFKKMISNNKHLTVTHKDMTRFFLSLEQAVDLIEIALQDKEGGKIFIPKVPSAKIMNLAELMTPPHSKLPPVVTGIRPGEKIHEILISEEELMRTEDLGNVYVIHDINTEKRFNDVKHEYSSKSNLMSLEELKLFLKEHNVI